MSSSVVRFVMRDGWRSAIAQQRQRIDRAGECVDAEVKMRWRALRVSSRADEAEHRARRDAIAYFQTRSVRVEMRVVINTPALADH